MSEVEERPRLVTAGYGRHRSQWVKQKLEIRLCLQVNITSAGFKNKLTENSINIHKTTKVLENALSGLQCIKPVYG